MEQDLPRASSNSSLSESSDGAGDVLGRSSDLAREMAETISSLQKLSRMEDSLDPRPTATAQRRLEVSSLLRETPSQGKQVREQTDGRTVGRTERLTETRVTVSSSTSSQRQAGTEATGQPVRAFSVYGQWVG